MYTQEHKNIDLDIIDITEYILDAARSYNYSMSITDLSKCFYVLYKNYYKKYKTLIADVLFIASEKGPLCRDILSEYANFGNNEIKSDKMLYKQHTKLPFVYHFRLKKMSRRLVRALVYDRNSLDKSFFDKAYHMTRDDESFSDYIDTDILLSVIDGEV